MHEIRLQLLVALCNAHVSHALMTYQMDGSPGAAGVRLPDTLDSDFLMQDWSSEWASVLAG